MESLRHPNIVAYKHTWLEIQRLSPFAPQVPCLFILMEYANGGNLEDYVLTETEMVAGGDSETSVPGSASFLPLEETLVLFLGICRGLQHLHAHGIIHRDLKPSNILLNYPSERITRPDILLSDFGECTKTTEAERVADGGRDVERTGATGTIEFCAPELLRQDERGRYVAHHSEATDAWSLGMLLYYMLYGGRLPYANIEDVEVLRRDMLKLRRIRLPPDLDRELPGPIRRLLLDLLSMRSEARPSAALAVQTVQRVLDNLAYRAAAPDSSPSKKSPPLLPGRIAPSPSSLTDRIPVVVPSIGLGLILAILCYPQAPSVTLLAGLAVPVLLDRLGIAKVWSLATLATCLIVYMLMLGSPCACPAPSPR